MSDTLLLSAARNWHAHKVSADAVSGSVTRWCLEDAPDLGTRWPLPTEELAAAEDLARRLLPPEWVVILTSAKIKKAVGNSENTVGLYDERHRVIVCSSVIFKPITQTLIHECGHLYGRTLDMHFPFLLEEAASYGYSLSMKARPTLDEALALSLESYCNGSLPVTPKVDRLFRWIMAGGGRRLITRSYYD